MLSDGLVIAGSYEVVKVVTSTCCYISLKFFIILVNTNNTFLLKI